MAGLEKLHREMLRVRMVEEAIAHKYAEQEMRCPCHLCIGQEAVSAGVCSGIEDGDSVFGTYRSHGLYLCLGGNVGKLISELYGNATGCTGGRGGSMQLVAPEVGLVCTSAIVGGTIPMAVGAALALQMSGTPKIAVCFFGEGATEEGVFQESLNFAALKQLPVVFICEHNYFATYSHQSARQSIDNVPERALALGVRAERIDGNDVLQVSDTFLESAKRARSGGGPSLIECRTYRWLEHVGPNEDTHLGYRSEQEVADWRSRCPVRKAETNLLEDGSLTQQDIHKLRKSIADEIVLGFEFSRQSKPPEYDPSPLLAYA